MKIAQINATYGYGSTGYIVKDIHQMLLDAGEDSYVFWATKYTEKTEDSRVIQIGDVVDHKLHALLYRIFHNQGWNSRLATYRLCRKLKRMNIEVVHLHNLHSNFIHLPMLLHFLAKSQIRTVITLHDCWFFTGHCTHFLTQNNCQRWRSEECSGCPVYCERSRIQQQVHKQFLEKKELFGAIESLTVIGVSDWITSCGQKSLLQEAASFCRIYNWIDCELFQPKDNRDEIRQKYGIPENKALILGVSQGWSEQKGLCEFQRISNVLSDCATVILVGEHGALTSNNNLKFIGYTKSAEELAELYSAADVFVNPSRMETFGKVTAEALACGTPVVAYDNTGTGELVRDGVGQVVEDGNVSQLIKAIESVLSQGKSKYSRKCRNYAVARFSKEQLLREYLLQYIHLGKMTY